MSRIVFTRITSSFPVTDAFVDTNSQLKDSIILNSSLKEGIILGRSEVTGITDKRCSRDHTKIYFDDSANELVIEQLGANPSKVSFGTEESVLERHMVKRLPVKPVAKGKVLLATLFLIHKDLLYGYDVYNFLDSNSKADIAEEKAQEGVKTSKPTKRKAGLDGFFEAKKPNNTAESLKEGEWLEIDKHVYFYKSSGTLKSNKIAAFDMDGTIITTASGAKWPKDKDDWKFLFPEVPKKLRQLHSDGYKVIIFTNQASIGGGTLKPVDMQKKISNIISQVGVPMEAIIAGSKHGVYRKPAPGMWQYIISDHNGDVKIDLGSCLYVGDAAGRPDNWLPGKKKDWACSDRLFALNIGVKFLTPEEFFKSMGPAKFVLPEFDPRKSLLVSNLLDPTSAKLILGRQEIIVMVGFPGSGKTHFSKDHLHSYAHVNRDSLGSWQKCVAKCEQFVKSGSSVVVDNTNPDEESRARYIKVAKSNNIQVRCFVMMTAYKQARHNEVYRQLTDPKHTPISEMVVNSYKSKYKEPTLSEGFLEIVKVNFLPKFKTDKEKELYSLYLTDK